MGCAILTPFNAEEMVSMNCSGSSTVASLTILRGRQMPTSDDSDTVALSNDGAVAIPE